MSEGMTYLNKGFVMFYSGTASNCLGSGEVKEVMQDIQEASRVTGRDRTTARVVEHLGYRTGSVDTWQIRTKTTKEERVFG